LDSQAHKRQVRHQTQEGTLQISTTVVPLDLLLAASNSK
jgi:regulatory protein YycH of two-component signal transduction system YycFG